MQTVGIIFVALFLAAVVGIRQLALREPDLEDQKDDTTEIADLEPQAEPDPEPVVPVEPEMDTGIAKEPPVEVKKEKIKLAPPSDVMASDGADVKVVYITWAKVENAEKYSILRADSEEGPFGMIGETAKTVYTDSRVHQNIDYYYKVQAWSASTGAGYLSSLESGHSSKVKLSKTYDIDHESEYMDAGETIWYYFEAIKDKWYCISWDDSDSYKKTGAYNGDVVVSAYRQNRETPYFLNREYPAAFISAATEPVYIKVEGDPDSKDHAGSHSISVDEREHEYYKFISAWDGADTAGDGLRNPSSVTVYSEEVAEFTIEDHIYIADTENSRVLRVDTKGNITARSGVLPGPHALACGKDGSVFLADHSINAIIKLSKDLNTTIGSWGSPGKKNSQFDFPAGVAVDATGQYVYVSDSNNHRIQKFGRSGNFILSWGGEGSGHGQFRNPAGLVVSPGVTGKYIFVVDTGNNRIQKFEEDGTFVKSWGGEGAANGQFLQPVGIAIDSVWDVYVVDSGNNRIQKFDHIGNFITSWGIKGSSNRAFNSLNGAAVDSRGNVYAVDSGNNRILKFRK
jgi:DNA-binding beta-propeller fold protein YncE